MSLLRIFPRTWQPFVLDLSNNTSTAVGGYLKGQLLIATFVGVFIGVLLTIFGIPSAPAIGLLAAVFNIVPYLGVVISIIPALLLAATTDAVVFKIIVVLVVFVAANQIEGHLLSPIVLGRTTDLHPVTVVLAILSGLALFGIAGALVAVPLTALTKLLLQEYYYPSRVYQDGP
jgi:predicted PurR-regulated permease PerM